MKSWIGKGNEKIIRIKRKGVKEVVTWRREEIKERVGGKTQITKERRERTSLKAKGIRRNCLKIIRGDVKKIKRRRKRKS